MDPLTFTIPDEATCDDDLQPAPSSPCDITEQMWAGGAAHIAGENLIPYPAGILTGRWREGYAAATVCAGRIISYISLAPIVLASEGAHAWRKITAGLFVNPAALPGTNLKGNALGMAAMIGLASRIPAKLGWQLFPTEVAPFASSLVFVPFRGFPGLATMGWRLPEEPQLHQVLLDFAIPGSPHRLSFFGERK